MQQRGVGRCDLIIDAAGESGEIGAAPDHELDKRATERLRQRDDTPPASAIRRQRRSSTGSPRTSCAVAARVCECFSSDIRESGSGVDIDDVVEVSLRIERVGHVDVDLSTRKEKRKKKIKCVSVLCCSPCD